MNRILGATLAAVVLAACGTPVGINAQNHPSTGDAAWTLLGDAPGPRCGQTAVYDAARDRMLVFGGGANDLWAQPFSGPNAGGWERVEAGGDGPPPVGVVAVIDEGKDQLMVFPSDALDRAWILPLGGGGAWSLAGFGEAPQIELGFSLAVDPEGRRLFVYTSGQPEVWQLALDGVGTWEQVAGAPAVDGFSCRDDLVYDGAHGRLLVLSGGWPRGNVYALSLGASPAWTQLNTDQAWFAYGSTSIYDAAGRRYLVADPAADGWIWSFGVGDAAPQWTHLQVSSMPASRFQASGVYDAAHRRFVLFAGADGGDDGTLHDDTWAISLGDAPAWSQIGTLDETTLSTQGTALVAAGAAGSAVRFGGWSGTSSIVFDTATGSARPVGDAPTALMALGAGAWDPATGRLLVFGGEGATEQNQTWALDLQGKQWKEVDGPGARPAARSQHSMVLDPSGGRMLVFGGTVQSTYPSVSYFDDVWARGASSDAWTPIDVQGPRPSARAGHAAAFDDAGRRMLVHGGTNDAGALGDTWMLELEPSPRWVALHPAGDAPPPVSGHFAAYDPETRRFVVVANYPMQSTATFDGVSVWALSTDGEPRWARYCPTGTRPATADGVVWTDGALFVTSEGSAWRFDPSTPTCG